MLKASCSPVLTDLIKTTNAVITGIRVYTYGQPVKLQEFNQVSILRKLQLDRSYFSFRLIISHLTSSHYHRNETIL